eukprot:TRINITY_DN2591_c2_g1_i1.p1 TRINITY_DN2591_c2_g1~~TRINITY_DN2591_c2_g1_i1.p1  ORF type:complete len:307 (+),score=140.52 TRINITY_DN2591_c2_g1_i1:35-955(+)
MQTEKEAQKNKQNLANKKIENNNNEDDYSTSSPSESESENENESDFEEQFLNNNLSQLNETGMNSTLNKLNSQNLNDNNDLLNQNSKYKKLWELQLELNKARYENKKEVEEEEIRKHNNNSNSNKSNNSSRASTIRERKKKKEQLQKQEGKDVNRLKLLSMTAEDAEWTANQNNKKKQLGCNPLDPEVHYKANKRRVNYLPNMTKEYEEAKCNEGSSFYRQANDIDYGKCKVNTNVNSNSNVKRMVSELKQTIERRNGFSRRRTFYENADVSFINERNRMFNKKIGRAFDEYTVEIRQNLERGTAI